MRGCAAHHRAGNAGDGEAGAESDSVFGEAFQPLAHAGLVSERRLASRQRGVSEVTLAD